MSDDKGSVYLAVNKSMPGLVKIGMTTGDVRNRMKELSADTGVPTPFTCPYSCEVQNPAIIEKQLHEGFDYCRENNKREFFRTDWQAVRATLQSLGVRDVINEPSPKVGKFSVNKWAKEGNIENVRRALAEGGDPNKKDENKTTALMWAAELGHADIVKFLLDKEADPTRTNTCGQSALFNAENGVIAKMLLDKGADPNTTDRNNDSPLTHAVQKSRADVVEVLLNAGANPGYNLDSAIRQDNIEIVKMLLAKGANPKPHLDNAVRQDNIKIVKILLEEGADPKPHLYKAITEGRVKIVKMLLDKGADPKSHLDSAIRQGHVEIVKMLLEKGADPKSHLDTALKEGNVEIIKMFITKGVDRDECLASAAIGNYSSVVKELLATNTNATNACEIALQKDHPDVDLWWALELEGYFAISDNLTVKDGYGIMSNDRLFKRHYPGSASERFAALLLQKSMADRWELFTATMNENRGEKDHPDAVKLMLENNAEPWGCFTAIVDKNRADMVSVLFKHGLNPKDALEHATNVGHVSVIKALLDNHAYPKANMTNSLLLAIKKRRLDVISMLIRSGADPNMGVASAIQCNNEDVIYMFYTEGADPDKLIGWAVRSNHFLVKYLLFLKADPWVGLKAAKNHKVNANIKWMLRMRAFWKVFGR